MPSPALVDLIQQVNALPADDLQALWDYLEDVIFAPQVAIARPIVDPRGALGRLDATPDEDPIADALEELARERAAHFEAEWDDETG